MELRFIGSGDAFGSSGRFSTHFPYSGDTEWNDQLAAAARGADLFICECSSWERPLKGHINYRDLAPKLAALGAKRIILTHMNPDMLERRSVLAHETAADGMVVIL